jgi:hypothetical protein
LPSRGEELRREGVITVTNLKKYVNQAKTFIIQNIVLSLNDNNSSDQNKEEENLRGKIFTKEDVLAKFHFIAEGYAIYHILAI